MYLLILNRTFHKHQAPDNCSTHFQLGNYIRKYLKRIPSNPICTLNVVLNLKLDLPVTLALSGTFSAKTLSTCPLVECGVSKQRNNVNGGTGPACGMRAEFR